MMVTGFTEDQVNDTATPFGERGGFNCRHDWLIFETEAATEIREETRAGREVWERMNKAELVEEIVNQKFLLSPTAWPEERVTLVSFGSFQVMERKIRRGNNLSIPI